MPKDIQHNSHPLFNRVSGCQPLATTKLSQIVYNACRNFIMLIVTLLTIAFLFGSQQILKSWARHAVLNITIDREKATNSQNYLFPCKGLSYVMWHNTNRTGVKGLYQTSLCNSTIPRTVQRQNGQKNPLKEGREHYRHFWTTQNAVRTLLIFSFVKHSMIKQNFERTTKLMSQSRIKYYKIKAE